MSYIYFIGIKGYEEDIQPIKIGKTNNLNIRLRDLNTGSPHELEIKYFIDVPTDNLALFGERLLHEKFKKNKKHHEWFDICVKKYIPETNDYLNMFEEYEEWLFDENVDFDLEFVKNTILNK